MIAIALRDEPASAHREPTSRSPLWRSAVVQTDSLGCCGANASSGLRQDSHMEAKLEDLRQRAERSTTAEEAVELNTEILAVEPNDGVALNRLGRADQDLGYVGEAVEVFTRAVSNP